MKAESAASQILLQLGENPKTETRNPKRKENRPAISGKSTGQTAPGGWQVEARAQSARPSSDFGFRFSDFSEKMLALARVSLVQSKDGPRFVRLDPSTIPTGIPPALIP
jgi:hypothetical protein